MGFIRASLPTCLLFLAGNSFCLSPESSLTKVEVDYFWKWWCPEDSGEKAAGAPQLKFHQARKEWK
jgi:hypothetical protein